jgi:hypothetical protein
LCLVISPCFVILSCAFLFCLALLFHVAPHFLCFNAPLHCTTPWCFISWPIASPCLVVSFQVAPLLFSLLPCCFD